MAASKLLNCFSALCGDAAGTPPARAAAALLGGSAALTGLAAGGLVTSGLVIRLSVLFEGGIFFLSGMLSGPSPGTRNEQRLYQTAHYKCNRSQLRLQPSPASRRNRADSS